MTAPAPAAAEESWYFDFAAPDDGIAGYARLAIRAAGRRAWWWAAVVGDDVPFVLVRDHDVDPPKPGTLEIRASGLWAEPVCETPGEHWSVGLEAFGVALDDPVEAYRSERGDVTALGFDLEWEADGEPAAGDQPGDSHLAQPSAVHGDVLVGRRRFAIDGRGLWQHQSGPRDWGQAWSWVGGRYADPLPVDERGLLADARWHAPLRVGGSRLARAVMPDLVWAERLQPASSALG